MRRFLAWPRHLARRIRRAMRPGGMDGSWTCVEAGALQGRQLYVPDWGFGSRISAGTYEPQLTAAMQEIVRPGMTCFDVGGHLGYTALLLAQFSAPNGRVHVFEPLAANRRVMRAVFRRNRTPGIEVHPVALADRNGEMTFRASSDNLGKSSMGFLPELGGVPGASHDYARFRDTAVPVRRLDDLALPSPDVIKIDVEGAELAVLNGAATTIAKARPAIFVEAHSAELQKQVHDWMAEAAYVAYANAEPTGGDRSIGAWLHMSARRVPDPATTT